MGSTPGSQGRALGKAWKAFHRSNDIYVQYNCSHNSLAKNLSICVPLLELPYTYNQPARYYDFSMTVHQPVIKHCICTLHASNLSYQTELSIFAIELH